MKCVFCGNDLNESHQTIERRVNRKLFYIKNIPVDECKVCGEVYIDDHVITEIDSALESEQILTESTTTTILDFNHVLERLSQTSTGQNNKQLAFR
ncbi:MAG: YgiT-type zinc finger protein [Desulfitobacteriaceae bacterium]